MLTKSRRKLKEEKEGLDKTLVCQTPSQVPAMSCPNCWTVPGGETSKPNPLLFKTPTQTVVNHHCGDLSRSKLFKISTPAGHVRNNKLQCPQQRCLNISFPCLTIEVCIHLQRRAESLVAKHHYTMHARYKQLYISMKRPINILFKRTGGRG